MFVAGFWFRGKATRKQEPTTRVLPVFDNFIRRGKRAQAKTLSREETLVSDTLVGEARARRIRRVKLRRAHGGCLGTSRRRRTRIAAKSLGEPLNRH